MARITRKSLLVLAGLAVLAGAASAETKPAPARQLHWRSEMTGTNVPAGLVSETWVKGDRVRTVMETPLGESVVVVKDRVAYMSNGAMARKMRLDERTGKGPMPAPTDYATRLDELLKRGRKVGTEEVDGEVCDK